MTALPLAPPAGMRDLLHPESAARASLGRSLSKLFAGYGYDLIVTPPFELAEVLERGLATVDRRDVLRFVEPDSGEVALLRPDITPQIARVVATRLQDRPAPHRIRYHGTVLRRRRGRARRHAQISQVGVEHIGNASVDADVEVAALACRVAETAGLTAYRLELRHVRLGGGLLALLPANARRDAQAALATKDCAELKVVLARVDADDAVKKAITTLPRLYGGVDVLDEGATHLPASLVEGPLQELRGLARRLDAVGYGSRLAVDLGETRGMAYYTGTSFALLAAGPGEPIGAGGRYDELLGRFGAPMPATGFAADLDNLEWAASDADAVPESPPRLVAFGGGDTPLIAALRDAGAQVAVVPETDREAALAFARAWGYDAIMETAPEAAPASATRLADESARTFSAAEAAGLLSWLAPA